MLSERHETDGRLASVGVALTPGTDGSVNPLSAVVSDWQTHGYTLENVGTVPTGDGGIGLTAKMRIDGTPYYVQANHFTDGRTWFALGKEGVGMTRAFPMSEDGRAVYRKAVDTVLKPKY
jgi:hypothetical protein